MSVKSTFFLKISTLVINQASAGSTADLLLGFQHLVLLLILPLSQYILILEHVIVFDLLSHVVHLTIYRI
jgi:hypothetical protein